MSSEPVCCLSLSVLNFSIFFSTYIGSSVIGIRTSNGSDDITHYWHTLQEAVKFGYDEIFQMISNLSSQMETRVEFLFDQLLTGTQTFRLQRYDLNHERID